VALPPASPDLKPPERILKELRRALEGRVSGTPAAKIAAVEREATALAADPERGRRLAGWRWVRDTWAHLPPGFTAAS
jgi:hypothetical protein